MTTVARLVPPLWHLRSPLSKFKPFSRFRCDPVSPQKNWKSVYPIITNRKIRPMKEHLRLIIQSNEIHVSQKVNSANLLWWSRAFRKNHPPSGSSEINCLLHLSAIIDRPWLPLQKITNVYFIQRYHSRSFTIISFFRLPFYFFFFGKKIVTKIETNLSGFHSKLSLPKICTRAKLSLILFKIRSTCDGKSFLVSITCNSLCTKFFLLSPRKIRRVALKMRVQISKRTVRFVLSFKLSRWWRMQYCFQSKLSFEVTNCCSFFVPNGLNHWPWMTEIVFYFLVSIKTLRKRFYSMGGIQS